MLQLVLAGNEGPLTWLWGLGPLTWPWGLGPLTWPWGLHVQHLSLACPCHVPAVGVVSRLQLVRAPCGHKTAFRFCQRLGSAVPQ